MTPQRKCLTAAELHLHSILLCLALFHYWIKTLWCSANSYISLQQPSLLQPWLLKECLFLSSTVLAHATVLGDSDGVQLSVGSNNSFAVCVWCDATVGFITWIWPDGSVLNKVSSISSHCFSFLCRSSNAQDNQPCFYIVWRAHKQTTHSSIFQ